MIYYSDIEGRVYAFEEGEAVDKTLSLKRMTKEAIDLHINPPITDEVRKIIAKEEKRKHVSEIVVVTQNGNAFDGDEVSQNRMARAVTASERGDETEWVLSDNSVVLVAHEELKEALRLSGEEMTRAWIKE